MNNPSARGGLRPHAPYPAAYAPDHEYGGDRQSDDIPHVHARWSHAESECQQISHGQIEQPIGSEGYGHDYLHVLYAPQYAHRHVLHTVGQLEESHDDEQRRGDVDNLGVFVKSAGMKLQSDIKTMAANVFHASTR